MKNDKTVFIGCSSYDSINEKYLKLAKDVSTLFALNNYKIVMGGMKSGMMREVYNACIENNGKILDVHSGLYEKQEESIKKTTIKVNNTNEQIDFFIKCDILVFLPGGYGTFNEIFSSIMETFSDKCKGKLILVNYNHFYDELILMINKLYDENFIKDKNKLIIVRDEKEIENYL